MQLFRTTETLAMQCYRWKKWLFGSLTVRIEIFVNLQIFFFDGKYNFFIWKNITKRLKTSFDQISLQIKQVVYSVCLYKTNSGFIYEHVILCYWSSTTETNYKSTIVPECLNSEIFDIKNVSHVFIIFISKYIFMSWKLL